MLFRARRRVVAPGALVLALTAPAPAHAFQITVSGDDSNPVPAAGAAIRTMSPSVAVALTAGEKLNYSASVTGPDGANAITPVSCTSSGSSRNVDYRGNGTYTVTVQPYSASDYSCKTPTGSPTTASFTITASVALGALPGPVLLRLPNSFVTRTVPVPIATNPGALGTEVRYAAGGVLGPDGAISGPSAEGYVDQATGTVPLRLTTPGRYVVVARAKGFSTGSGQFFSPWSAPVTVDAFSPFDFESARTTDSRGPSYAISIRLREKTARGRVLISAARGTKGGRFRSLGSARLSSRASFRKRFTLRRSGTYRLRFRFKGSPTTAPGIVEQRFRVSRRVIFG